VSWQRAVEEAVGGPVVITAQRTVPSSVTLNWKVEWSPMEIARDLWQNFRDANQDDLDAIQTTVGSAGAWISAPAMFELERLYYLGSEKGEGDVGQYGEGFKAACVSIIRGYQRFPIAISGRDFVRISVGPAVAGTQMIPLVYEWGTIEPAYPGHLLVIPDCPPTIATELRKANQHFAVPSNPLLQGPCIYSIPDVLDVYALAGTGLHTGGMFYHHLLRAMMPGAPFSIVWRKKIDHIESLIGRDRDRRVFEGELLGDLYDTFAYELDGHAAIVRTILTAMEPEWPRGHPLLAALAQVWAPNENITREQAAPGAAVRVSVEFAPLLAGRYYAATNTAKASTAVALTVRTQEALFRDAGLVKVPKYFTEFGVISASAAALAAARAAARDRQRDVATPTPEEAAALAVCAEALASLAPDLSEHFLASETQYLLGDSAVVLGELRAARGFDGRGRIQPTVYLARSVFERSFGYALSVYLHEHAHLAGSDGSRGFSDALTRLLAAVIDAHTVVPHWEAAWRAAVSVVPRSERVLAARELKTASLEAAGGKKKRATGATLEDIMCETESEFFAPPATFDRVSPDALREYFANPTVVHVETRSHRDETESPPLLVLISGLGHLLIGPVSRGHHAEGFPLATQDEAQWQWLSGVGYRTDGPYMERYIPEDTDTLVAVLLTGDEDDAAQRLRRALVGRLPGVYMVEGGAIQCGVCEQAFADPSAIAVHVQSEAHRRGVAARCVAIMAELRADDETVVPYPTRLEVDLHSAAVTDADGFDSEAFLDRLESAMNHPGVGEADDPGAFIARLDAAFAQAHVPDARPTRKRRGAPRA
jgi:hypothetical protein